MPMRGELTLPALRAGDGDASAVDAWTLIIFCAVGVALTLYFAWSTLPWDQFPLLMMQYNGM